LRTSFVCFSIGVLATTASPCLGADVNHGQELARRWCASCHVVAANQQQPVSEAPTFASVAKAPGFDVNRLAYFLLAPHPKMPDMSLTRFEAADIAAYIGSLAKQEK